jgi:thiamine-phosphate pyrophosphorylase
MDLHYKMDLTYKTKRGIYLISPEIILNLNEFKANLKFILKNVNIAYFQLRLKNITDEEIIEIINVIKPICIKYNTEFILNDNFELAAQYALDGLHIGQSDGYLAQIQRKFSGIIGVSCYNDVKRALNVSKFNIQYVSFGAFYKSETKPNAVNCPISCLVEFKRQSNVSVCAIGGINSSNAEILIKNGADLIALSSAVWNIQKQRHQVEELKKILSFFES